MSESIRDEKELNVAKFGVDIDGFEEINNQSIRLE